MRHTVHGITTWYCTWYHYMVLYMVSLHGTVHGRLHGITTRDHYMVLYMGSLHGTVHGITTWYHYMVSLHGITTWCCIYVAGRISKTRLHHTGLTNLYTEGYNIAVQHPCALSVNPAVSCTPSNILVQVSVTGVSATLYCWVPILSGLHALSILWSFSLCEQHLWPLPCQSAQVYLPQVCSVSIQL